MVHDNILRYKIAGFAIAAALGLSACGSDSPGNDGTDSQISSSINSSSIKLSGKVADGYLVGAKVCLDLNGNKVCDAGEPTATSTAGGRYTFEATQAQIDTSPVVVEIIAGVTVDEDNTDGLAITKKYTLTAPVGKTFVSPLTTMVQAQIEKTGKTAAQIELELLASLGQSTSGVSLFEDYVEKKSESSTATTEAKANYKKLHKIAQVTASILADNIASVKIELDKSGARTLPEALDALIILIVDEVVKQLSAIKTEVDKAPADGPFTPSTVTVNVETEVDLLNVENNIAAIDASNNTTATTFQTLITAGFNWIYAENNWYQPSAEYGTISQTDDGITQVNNEYDFRGETFLASQPGTDDDFRLTLTADGWVKASENENLSQCSLTSTDDSGTFTCPNETFTVTVPGVIDLANTNIAAFLANNDTGDFASFIDTSAKFAADARGFDLSITNNTESYKLWPTSQIYPHGPFPPAVVLSNMLVSQAWVDDGNSQPFAFYVAFKAEGCEAGECTLHQGLNVELVGSGTSGAANFYLLDYLNRNPETNYPSITLIASSTWSIETINTVKILTYDIPASFETKYAYLLVGGDEGKSDNIDETRIYSEFNGWVREGRLTPGGSTREDVAFDNIAIEDIISAFDGSKRSSPPLLPPLPF
jgi:hypothetical protein